MLALKWLLLLVAVRKIGRRPGMPQASGPIESEPGADHFGTCS